MKFQTIIMVIFGGFVVIALLFFGGVIKVPKKTPPGQSDFQGSLEMWGTFDKKDLKIYFSDFRSQNPGTEVKYTEIPEEDYDDRLLRAFATGQVPDMFFIPHDLIAKYENQIIPIPLASYTTRTFSDFYARGAEVFISGDQVLSYPIGVDPLVLYYNKDLTENEDIAQLPKIWTGDFIETVEKLSVVKSDGLKIDQAAVAMGESENIKNFDSILSLMMLQLGHYPVARDGNLLDNKLKDSSVYSGDPAKQVLNFFSSFSDPVNNVYTWNKSMREAQDEFIRGNLVLYFGFGTELLTIQRRNPNLNFDVNQVPQVDTVPSEITYGKFYGIAVPKLSQKQAPALRTANLLSNGIFNQTLVDSMGLQPVRRDLLSKTPDHLYRSVFYGEALRSRAWVNPNPTEVRPIWKQMIEQIITGNLSTTKAISEAHEQINFVIQGL